MFLLPLLSSITINVADFGAVPNSSADSGPAFAKAVEACRLRHATDLVIPKGTYRFFADTAQLVPAPSKIYPPQRTCVLLSGLEKLTVHAGSATFLFDGRMSGLIAKDCRNLRVDGLSVDGDSPTVAEAEVIEADEYGLTLRFDPLRYPVRAEGGHLSLTSAGEEINLERIEEMDSEGQVVENTGDALLGDPWPVRARPFGSGVIRLDGSLGWRPIVGRRVLLRRLRGGPPGLIIRECEDVVLSGVAVHYADGFGFFGIHSRDISVEGCRVTPSPGRAFSTWSDATHWTEMRGRVRVANCLFRGSRDDSANVQGNYVQILRRIDDRTLACVSKSRGLYLPGWADSGDQIDFIDPASLLPAGRGEAASIRVTGPESFEISFRAEVPSLASKNWLLDNASDSPDFEYVNNDDGFHRARGVLATTRGKVRIEGNRFRTAGSAILISADVDRWYESGQVSDVLIKNNTFESCNTSPYESGEAVITIAPNQPEAKPAHRRFHRNIRIESNRFIGDASDLLYARSVEGLTFRDNQEAEGHAGLLRFDGCLDVTLEGNRIQALRRRISTRGMTSGDVKLQD